MCCWLWHAAACLWSLVRPACLCFVNELGKGLFRVVAICLKVAGGEKEQNAVPIGFSAQALVPVRRMGEATFTTLAGLSDAWDSHLKLRSRVRSLGRLVAEKPPAGEKEAAPEGSIARTVDNLKYNADAVRPLLALMSGTRGMVPCVETLSSQIRTFYEAHGLNPTNKQCGDDAWSLRYMLGVVKAICHRDNPPRDGLLRELLSVFGVNVDEWKKD